MPKEKRRSKDIVYPDLEKLTSNDVLAYFKLVTIQQSTFQSIIYLFKLIGPAIILLIYEYKRANELREKRLTMEAQAKVKARDSVNNTPLDPGEEVL
jgi:hypothetical protein